MSKFGDKLAELGFGSYEEYLNSPHWRKFKSDYSQSGRTNACVVCRSPFVELHHHTYERLGAELFDDVTPLCRKHHDGVHEWLKTTGKVFVTYTFQAVEYLKSQEVVIKRSTKTTVTYGNKNKAIKPTKFPKMQKVVRKRMQEFEGMDVAAMMSKFFTADLTERQKKVMLRAEKVGDRNALGSAILNFRKGKHDPTSPKPKSKKNKSNLFKMTPEDVMAIYGHLLTDSERKRLAELLAQHESVKFSKVVLTLLKHYLKD